MSPTARDAPAYNTAYLAADRSHLVARYDVDPELAAGREPPECDQRVAPTDLQARRRAVLAFYGHRCGRCTRPVATTDPGTEETLGFAFSVGRIRGAEAPWALAELVAVCEPCFDLLDPAEPVAVGTVATRFHEAPQFPAWWGDPRVAVERAPLTGRELFRRERLDRRVPARFDFGVNDAVAAHAALALDTPASRAVALGESLLAARTGPPGRDVPDPERDWAACQPAERRRYERRVRQPRAVAAADRAWLTPWEAAFEHEDGGDEPVAVPH